MTALLDPAPFEPAPVPRLISTPLPTEDRVFQVVMRAAATVTLALLGLIGLFLFLRGALPTIRQEGWRFLTEREWLPNIGRYGVAALAVGTVVVGGIAMLLAVPVGLLTALFISEYAPARLRGLLVSLVDLMAAVPSIVYGLWGFFFLQPRLLPFARWIATHAGGTVPFLSVEDPSTPSSFTSSAFIAAGVVGVMVIPTTTAVMRQVFSQAPLAEREAALALGCTKWAMIRAVVLPFGKAGIIGASMLGLGRALGETIAVYLVISFSFDLTTHPLQSGTTTIASFIASQFHESSPAAISALLAAGLVLFLMTLVVNTLAGLVVARARSGATTEI